mmetsp:Transcript_16979/g.19996  ORF Transcript_16979/g.19996 Transcript_16979/m.19996 type:complete len:120 (+) Transcript_16979:24-383(+)
MVDFLSCHQTQQDISLFVEHFENIHAFLLNKHLHNITLLIVLFCWNVLNLILAFHAFNIIALVCFTISIISTVQIIQNDERIIYPNLPIRFESYVNRNLSHLHMKQSNGMILSMVNKNK